MSTTCTRCDSTGFLNIEQVPAEVINSGADAVLEWMKTTETHDVQVCDCCGDGEGWYGTPGEHYTSEDPSGKHGPYSYNGGLCECH